jgi:uncharacterized RDD family membrane protein YckC
VVAPQIALASPPPSVVAGRVGESKASKAVRIGGFAIDFVILVILVPVIGAVPYLYPVIATGYILLRDTNGASLGKLMLGCQVLSKNGAPATTKQLILRNLIFVLGDIVAWVPIPWLGAAVDALGFGGLAMLEGICLLVMGERIGDMIAGTMVVKRG